MNCGTLELEQASAAGSHAVETRGVCKRYGDALVLDDVTISVDQGQFLSLLGPSGCGKTTTLRVLAGFERPNSGDVRIDGASVLGLPPWKRDIGIVFQTYALFPYLSAADNVAFGLKMRKVPRAERDRAVADALRMVGLEGFAARYPHQLSGGQRQRVALARALVFRPKLLLLDEPLSNLDARLRDEMRLELKRIQRESGVTTVFVTHDQQEAFSLSDRIVVMNKGRVVQAGTPREIWERPASAFVAGFVGVENLFPAVVSEGGGVRLDSGTVLASAGLGFAPGTRVVVGVRARDVRLAPPAEDRHAGRVRDVEYLGDRVAVRLDAPAFTSPVTIIADPSEAPSGEVGFAIDDGRIMTLSDDR